MDEPGAAGAPQRLTDLASWQAGRISTVGARLTGRRMPLPARADFAVLAALDERGPLSQADLGRLLGLDRNNINAIVGRLDDLEHVRRTPHPTDRRRNVVDITDAGTARLDELDSHARAVQDELLTALSEQERTQLHALMQKVLSAHGPQQA